VRETDNLTAIYEPIVLGRVCSATSHNPTGLRGLLTGIVFVFYATIALEKIMESRKSSR
jgi:hypothetical protein